MESTCTIWWFNKFGFETQVLLISGSWQALNTIPYKENCDGRLVGLCERWLSFPMLEFTCDMIWHYTACSLLCGVFLKSSSVEPHANPTYKSLQFQSLLETGETTCNRSRTSINRLWWGLTVDKKLFVILWAIHTGRCNDTYCPNLTILYLWSCFNPRGKARLLTLTLLHMWRAR